MSHVDEGALHAYLDGALDDHPTEEAAEIRAHLEGCVACGARLEEARQLRAAAAEILAEADPGPMELPSLEELRREARAGGGGQSRLSRLQRMAWAASVVVALGAGWMVRDQLTTFPDATSMAPVAPTPAVGEEVEEGGLERARQEAALPVSAREADMVAEVPPAFEDRPGLGLAAEARRDSVALAGAPAERAPDAIRVAEEESGRRTGEQARLRADAPVLSAQASAMERAPVEAFRAADAVDKAAGEIEDEPGALSVPGLRVLSVSWVELPGGAAVRVLQLLEPADTLELLHLPAGIDPSGLAPVGADESELVVPREEGWLVLRGPLGVDVLRALLTRLEGAG